ncbi:hypothetical protein, partial [Pararhizobium mangrovi]|uniref:hypothetical protein n=1 Tax=Pararhizobium mangrovi TaxID=2590452 RepID=UPI001AEEAE7A
NSLTTGRILHRRGKPHRRRFVAYFLTALHKWIEQQIASIQSKLSKTFGKSLHSQRWLFARALGEFSPSAVKAIIEEHAADYPEDVKERLREAEDDEDEEN